MKKYIQTSLILFLIILSSCDTDTDSTIAFPAEDLITDLSSAQAAVIGIHNGLTGNSATSTEGYILGVNGYGMLGTYADEFTHTGSFSENAESFGNALNTANLSVQRMWYYRYKTIFRANSVISGVDGLLSGGDRNVEELNRILGQAKAIRAFLYFDLVRLYGAVPLVTKFSVEVTEVENTGPRVSVDKVYEQIEKDLNEAVAHFNQGLSFHNPNLFNLDATYVLKAKVEMELAKYAEAKITLDKVIGKYSLAPDISVLYGKSGTTSDPESIFTYMYTSTFSNSLAFYFFPSANAGRGEYSLNSLLTSAFEKDDDQRKNFVRQGYLTKYSNPGSGADNVPVYRYADVLLMYAECSARGGDFIKGSEYVNQIRKRASKDLTDISLNASNYVDIIFKERFLEFYGEGQRWYDVKRAGLAKKVIESKGNNYAENKKDLWPIPFVEIERNPDISSSDQNEGYK